MITEGPSPACSSESDAVRELPDEGEQALRLFKLRQVTGFWDELEASVWQRLGIGTAILRVSDAIAFSPHDESRDAHAPQAPSQLWIRPVQPLIIHVQRLDVFSACFDLFRAQGRWIDAEGCRIVEAEG